MKKETKQKIANALMLTVVIIGAIQLNNRVIEPAIEKAKKG